MFSQIRQYKDRVIARLLTRYPSLFRAWEKKSQGPTFPDSPWHPLSKPVSKCKVSLVTTGGVHLLNQPAFDMDNPDGDATFREIPADVMQDQLKITHNYYDNRDASEDVNIILPFDSVRILADTKEIGEINHRHFSFMGHIQNDQLQELMSVTAPQVARLLKQDGVDVVILSPA